MAEHQIELQPLLWGVGWLAAVLVLFWAGLRLPLQTRLGPWSNWLYTGGVVVVGFGLFALANVALTLHDGHIDLTRERIYTPSAAALKVMEGLGREVRVTYFYHSQDPAGRRARDILQLMQRRNPLFRLTAVDPDKEPAVARTNGIRIYNAAMIEADGRRVMVQSTDEAEIRTRRSACAARAGHHYLLHRRPQRTADGQFRVPHASREYRRAQP